jgi:nicotinate-nucleotide pyrophosphorylase (carboxylating)
VQGVKLAWEDHEFGRREIEACCDLLTLALREDLGEAGDVTSLALVPATAMGTARFVARADGIVAGLPAAALTCRTVDPHLVWVSRKTDGDRVGRGDVLAEIRGSLRSILAAERIALNFLQRLSGVATQTRSLVDLLRGLPTRLLDTRKTPPGWRLLDKYAFRVGGGQNHRLGLHDMILIKDNHLAALSHLPDPVGTAIQRARASSPGVRVEIEVDSLTQLEAALPHQPDYILLDNMTLEQMRECVRRRDAAKVRTLLEASGGITAQTIRAVAETGVDRISVGAVTHSALALDIALDFVVSSG